MSMVTISIMGLTTVHSVATIIVAWGVSTTRIIPKIIVVGVVVLVMITIWAHGPSGLVKPQRSLCIRRCDQRCNW